MSRVWPTPEHLRSRRDQVAAVFYRRFPGILDRPVITEVTQELLRILTSGTKEECVVSTLNVWINVELSSDLIDLVAMRIVGDEYRLQHSAILPWLQQYGEEQVLAVVTATRRLLRSGSDPATELHWRIVTGTPAGMETTVVWSDKVLGYWTQTFGFRSEYQRRKSLFPFVSPYELTGLWAVLELDPTVSVVGRPGFRKILVPENYRVLNRETISRRYRTQMECPIGFQHECYQCARGYDVCGFGTHPCTFTTVECAVCGQSELCDPRFSQSTCIHCVETLTTAELVARNREAARMHVDVGEVAVDAVAL